MKATINGITIEGTPQEIAELMKLQAQPSVPVQPQAPWNPYGSGAWWGIFPTKITCGGSMGTTDQLKYMQMYNDACEELYKNITMQN